MAAIEIVVGHSRGVTARLSDPSKSRRVRWPTFQPPERMLERSSRYRSGEWGKVPSEDACDNRSSVEHGFRGLDSSLIGEAGAKVWIIAEAYGAGTCVLLPSVALLFAGGPGTAFANPIGPVLDRFDAEIL